MITEGQTCLRDRLVSPISEAEPTGVDVRQDRAFLQIYYKVKDARASARASERSAVPGEPMRLPSAWTEVRDLCDEALSGTTKDLELLAWLAEAELRLRGFAGLAEVLDAAAALVDAHWETLHSIDAESPADKAAPFAGLNGVGGEGTLIQPLRLAPLVPGAPFYEFGLWDFELAERPGEESRRQALRDAVASAGRAAMAERLGEVEACLAAHGALTAAFDARLGADAPPSANTRAVLERCAAAIRLAADLGHRAAAPAESAPAAAAAAEASTSRPAAPAGTIGSREEALERLAEIGRYFRAAEPHSPLSLAIETLVARARLDFSQLLDELVHDAQIRRTILLSAGIRPHSDS